MFVGTILFFNRCAVQPVREDNKMQFIAGQFEKTLAFSADTTKIPRTVTSEGELKTTGIYGWTSGFFAGSLWYMYEITGDEKWKVEAKRWTEALAPVQHYTDHHDVGFIINCSYGNGLRLTGTTDYETVIVQTAKSLSTRFNPEVGCIKSWNYKKSWDGETEWFYPVIIDNMMNLELLFEATRLSGDSAFYKTAVTHAITTMKNHYREDYSCFHVVNYDTLNGQVLDRATNQGLTDQSAWARGQAWGLYGFTLCYRYTKDVKFLHFAENIADYILDHPDLPQDMVPYWDFNAGNPQMVPEWDINASEFSMDQRDASAAAIIGSALFELSAFSQKGAKYADAASKIVKSLASPGYMPIPGNNSYFILDHCVGSIPHGVEIDVPLVYADYYFLEALKRKKDIEGNMEI